MNKIICFNIKSAYANGGMERMCTSLASCLAEEGYQVHVISFEDGKMSIPFFPISPKVKLYNLLSKDYEVRIHVYMRWLGYAKWKYKRYIKSQGINLIIDVGTTLSPFSTPIAQDLGVKHIAWDHFCYKFFLERPSYSQILPCLKSGVDKLVVLTQKDLYNYVNLSHIPAEKVVQIYNYSAIEEEQPTLHERKHVLAMGRLQKQKGFDLLLKAWEIVEHNNNEWDLEIVGEGPEFHNLQNQIKDLNLKRVIISPPTENPRLKYEQSSIFVLSSRFEGLGLVIMEAANMSLPIVSFDCENGPNELIEDGVSGYLVPVGDTKMMAERLLLLIKDHELRNQIGINALNSMQKYNRRFIIQRWIDLIDKV